MSNPEENLAEGTLISHLLELRNRLMRAFLAVIVVFIPCALYANDLFNLLAKPIQSQLPEGSSLIATSITATFMTPFKLAFIVALIIAMPYVLYQIWAFVAPGLYRREKRFARPLLISAIILFYCGVAFAYFLVLPAILGFFVTTTPESVRIMPNITEFVSFMLTMSFAFGVAFEMPVAVVLLAITGLLPVAKLTQARGYVLIGIFVVAAFLTPPDAISQTLMAVPMYVLYEGGILFARLLARHKATDQDGESAA